MPPQFVEVEDKKLPLDGKQSNDPGLPAKSRTKINGSRIGVWELYEEVEVDPPRISLAELRRRYRDLADALPYVIRMANDVLDIPGCASLVAAYAAIEFFQALLPAVLIWFQGEALQFSESVVDSDTLTAFDLKMRFLSISIGLMVSSIASALLTQARRHVETPLNARIRRWYSLHSFRARARLDLATYSDATIRQQIDDSDNMSGQTVVYRGLELATGTLSATAQLFASVVVLLRVLRGQQDGAILVALTLFVEALYWLPQMIRFWHTRVWIATTSNENYLRMRGWQHTIRDFIHRKEFVAGGIAGYAISEFQDAAERVGHLDADWDEVEEQVLHPFNGWTVLAESLKHIPQVYFMFRIAQHSTGTPVSLISLTLIQSAAHRFAFTAYEIIQRTKSVGSQLESLKKFYELDNIQNVVHDGTVPFPEDSAQVRSGIELEFRNVSFRYPDAETWALRNISFKLLPGQLCVIVGTNGAGKSTILKLITRLYDPNEGSIIFAGRDIRTLKLDDLRRCISVLFQDYTLFPLSIRDNIALGDPTGACSSSLLEIDVEQAARLAGVEDFLGKLPKGLDTYLMRPVRDTYSRVASGKKMASGRTINYDSLRTAAGAHKGGPWAGAIGLSGGQIQRLAVARAFMGSIVKEEGTVGMLLFDEPSASLDPVAEHDLFSLLRQLRGSKTMLFSSHRFGNLTGFADVILYMNETGIVESGTHDELLLQKGEYAKLWTIQAEAFL